MAGTLQLALGLLKMGFITNFIPHPVLSGFIYTSAIVIAISQDRNLLGISLSSGEDSTPGTVLELGRRIGETNLVALAVGAGSILALAFIARALPACPVPSWWQPGATSSFISSA